MPEADLWDDIMCRVPGAKLHNSFVQMFGGSVVPGSMCRVPGAKVHNSFVQMFDCSIVPRAWCQVPGAGFHVSCLPADRQVSCSFFNQ